MNPSRLTNTRGGGRKLIVRERAGATANLIQNSPLTFARLFIEQPTLIYVRQGRKIIEWPDGHCTANAGDAVVLAPGLSLDVTNCLDLFPRYEAIWISWDHGLLEEFNGQQPAASGPWLKAFSIPSVKPGFVAAIEGAIAGLVHQDKIPLDIARHRLMEVLLWIRHHGGLFTPLSHNSLASRLRQLLTHNPAQQWQTQQVARHFAMSEATLRRRLAQEQTSLTELLIDVRMSTALSLLQCTDYPVAHIAQTVGYESPSRFAIRFRQRFGCAPTEIRGRQRSFLKGR